MARVLLVNPPFYRLLGSHYNGLSLGLAYLASALNARGHDAWLYNADYTEGTAYKTLHQIFETFHGFDQAPVQEAIDQIVAFRPDWVGYTCYTAVIPVVARISSAVKQRMPGVRQVVGGPHPTLDTMTSYRLPAVDYVIRGEGEVELANLLDEEWARGTYTAGRIRDLDGLQFPERGRFWAGSGRDVCYLSTARGCPWRCAYCASPAIWPRVFSRSPENVLREVETLPISGPTKPEENGNLHIMDNTCLYIIDDTFTFNEQRALKIIAGLRGIPWKCEARADTITDQLAEAMAASGCARVKMGVESGSDRILKSVNKGETTEDMRTAVRRLQRHGVPVTCYLMAGFSGETDDDLRQTIAFARELQADYYSISMVAPYYGTRLYDDAKAVGIPVDHAPWEVFFHQNDSLLLNPNLSRDLLEELWGLCDVRRYV